jgi:glycosyltransferase involved in cell wall biosynthesis
MTKIMPAAVLKQKLRSAWRRLPVKWRQWLGPKLLHPVLQAYYKSQLSAPLKLRPEAPSPVVVAGLFRTANGIGEGARSTYRMLKEQGLQPIAVDLSEFFHLVDMETDIPLSQMPKAEKGTLVLQLNSPETPKALRDLGLKGSNSWYVIGFWAWELPAFPEGWDKHFDLVSEIWTPSSFCKKAIAQHQKAPKVSTFGHKVYPPNNLIADRAAFNLPEEAYVYITMADSFSSLDRKNPFAAIEAFKSSFAHDPKKILLVKTRNLSKDPRAEKDIKTSIAGHDNIRLLDQSLTEQKRWQLMQSCDALISLHRAEGFGLTIAEMQALGKKVIVTAWSGNMDFCTPDNAVLVDYKLVPCIDRYGRYNYPEAVWAQVENLNITL